MWIFYLVLGLLAAYSLYVIFRCVSGRWLLRDIKQSSLIIAGPKGSGKTLLFSEMSRMEKNGYLSTTDFKHKKQERIGYGDIKVEDITWKDVLENKIHTIKKQPWEKKTVYLDDAGVYLPNFADQELKKRYPSMPIAYAVWRHLYDAPIHINSQAVDRVWKLIREQADGYIICKKTSRLGPFAIIKATYYDRIESAQAQLSPMGSRLFNKYSKAEVDKFKAEHGTIKNFWIFAPTWRNKYDSRYFHKVFFGFDWRTPKRLKLAKR